MVANYCMKLSGLSRRVVSRLAFPSLALQLVRSRSLTWTTRSHCPYQTSNP